MTYHPLRVKPGVFLLMMRLVMLFSVLVTEVRLNQQKTRTFTLAVLFLHFNHQVDLAQTDISLEYKTIYSKCHKWTLTHFCQNKCKVK